MGALSHPYQPTFSMPALALKSIIWEEGDWYVAQCINLDVCSIGHTREEAIRKLDVELQMALRERPAGTLPYITGLEIITTNVVTASNGQS